MSRPLRIHNLAAHPDAEALSEHDHPRASLKGWRGVLTAKAWADRNQLACFFAEAEHGLDRFVFIFKAYRGYQAAFGAEDMREARIGSTYELDVFAPDQGLPIVDRVGHVGAFRSRR